jgi:hypothetical protein
VKLEMGEMRSRICLLRSTTGVTCLLTIPGGWYGGITSRSESHERVKTIQHETGRYVYLHWFFGSCCKMNSANIYIYIKYGHHGILHSWNAL